MSCSKHSANFIYSELLRDLICCSEHQINQLNLPTLEISKVYFFPHLPAFL